MAGVTAEPLLLRAADRDELVALMRATAGRSGLAVRARIVLLAADGVPNVEIARLVGMSRPTVNLWRGRYAEGGVSGLADAPRPGRPKRVDAAAIITGP